MSRELLDAINSHIKPNEPANCFLSQLMSVSWVYLFGGGVRDFLDGNFEEIRDLDFVVRSKSKYLVNIEKYIPKDKNIKFTKNRFGGYKIFFDSLIIDIWNMEDTWLFKKHRIKISEENLINSVYLNIDALLYLLNKKEYLYDCDKNYIKIKKSKLLDIKSNKTPYEELNLLRALVFKKKYSLVLSNELKKQFKKYIKQDINAITKNFMDLQEEHYNRSILSKDTVYNELININF